MDGIKFLEKFYQTSLRDLNKRAILLPQIKLWAIFNNSYLDKLNSMVED